MNLTIDFAKIYTTPREVAQILWQNALLSYELEYLISIDIEELKVKSKTLTISSISTIVCNYFNIDKELIQKSTNKREIVQCRQIVMYFCKLKTKETLAAIGSEICDRNHSTVSHAIKVVNNLCDTDKKFRDQIKDIEKRLK